MIRKYNKGDYEKKYLDLMKSLVDHDTKTDDLKSTSINLDDQGKSLYDDFYGTIHDRERITNNRIVPEINLGSLTKGINYKFIQTYNIEDIDKLILLLTIWIDDRSVIEKMEKMYNHWKDLQKIKKS